MTPEQQLMSATVKAVFRLNGQLLSVAETLARPVGLTAAWWQVLGAVLDDPLPVADIARAVGITRQSVQRVADLLVDRELAEYRPNPAHRRAKLLCPTDGGRAAVDRIAPAHQELARELADKIGADQLAQLIDGLEQLSAAFAALVPASDAYGARNRD